MPLLEVESLTVSFPTPDGLVEPVRGVSFNVDQGCSLAIVGESGSGKSVTAQTLLGLTRGARVTGRALFEQRDLLTMSPSELRAVRGAKIGMIFQDPFSSVHPCHRVGAQVAEVIRIHRDVSRGEARRRAVELLDMVGIAQPEARADDYPHQFSGGMLQRVMIAMAIALEPDVIIADEPTTALDTTVQAQILRLLKSLQERMDAAVVVITHDLSVVANAADEVVVMYAGKIMERASCRDIYDRPHHPYTVGLLQSLPRADRPGGALTPIAGQPPAAVSPPNGCPFRARCEHAVERCEEDQSLVGIDDEADHRSACWLPAGVPS